MDNFWEKTLEEIKNLNNSDFKNQELPLARIKKIMKLDDDVKVMVIMPFFICFAFSISRRILDHVL